MTVPKTMEEVEQRARIVAEEAAADWDQMTEAERRGEPRFEVYQDAYASELYELRALMSGGPSSAGASGVDDRARDLVELCVRLRFETDAPSALGIAVGALIGAAETRYQHLPDVALAEIVAALVGIFGTGKVRAAVGADPRSQELMREEFEIMRTIEKNLPPPPSGPSYSYDERMDELADVIELVLRLGVGRGATLLLNDLADVTDEPLKAAVDLLLKAAAKKWFRGSHVDLQEVVGGLVEIYDAGRVHGAVTIKGLSSDPSDSDSAPYEGYSPPRGNLPPRPWQRSKP